MQFRTTCFAKDALLVCWPSSVDFGLFLRPSSTFTKAFSWKNPIYLYKWCSNSKKYRQYVTLITFVLSSAMTTWHTLMSDDKTKVWRPQESFDLYPTGWPKSKFLISNGSTARTNHIWSYVGKVKIGLRGGSFFLVSANFYIHFKYKGEKWQFSSSASMV